MQSKKNEFSLRNYDLEQLKGLEKAFRTFLMIPDLSAKEIVGLGRAILLVQRLPYSTPELDVTVSLDYRSQNFVSSYTVSISPERVEVECGSASRVCEGEPEFESSPGSYLSVDVYGEYDRYGSKNAFLSGFFVALDELVEQPYKLMVRDDSNLAAFPSMRQFDLSGAEDE